MNLKHLLIGIAATGVLAAAACGGGDSKTAVSPTVGIATAPAAATSASSPSAAATATSGATPTAAASATATTPAAASPTTTTAVATPPPAPTAPPAPTTAPPPPAVTSVTVTAENLTFDRAVIRVKAGTTLTATFINKDTGVDHNLSFSLPGLGHPTCLGPCTTTQTITPTSAGTFSFFCTLHATMFGDFIVD